MTMTQSRPPSTPPHTRPIPCSVWFGPVVSASEERDMIEHLVADHGVAVCVWPRDAERVGHLAEAHVPRLLLVRSDGIPPAPAAQQAWVPTSASNDEIHTALVTLSSWPEPAGRRSA